MENHFHITVNVACQLGTDTQTTESKGSNLEALFEGLGPLLGMLGNFGIKPEPEAQPEQKRTPKFKVGDTVYTPNGEGKVLAVIDNLTGYEYKVTTNGNNTFYTHETLVEMDPQDVEIITD
jgi:hypothetical protein